jgi:hypothetical protein
VQKIHRSAKATLGRPKSVEKRPDCTVDKNTQNLILPLLLYGCEEWTIIYVMGRREEKLRVLENGVLREAFGPERVGGSRNRRQDKTA